jgi:hypothetical protein
MKPVKIAIWQAPPTAAGRSRAAARTPAPVPSELAPAGITSLTFGDDMVFCGAGKPWGQFSERAGHASLAMQEHPEEINRERLHVVVQKGRLFQREHPDVPVLVDKGRYLLVDLELARARAIGSRHVPSFAVQPIDAFPATRARGRHRVVFNTSTNEDRAAADPAIQQLVDRIARPDYEADLTQLVNFKTRN